MISVRKVFLHTTCRLRGLCTMFDNVQHGLMDIQRPCVSRVEAHWENTRPLKILLVSRWKVLETNIATGHNMQSRSPSVPDCLQLQSRSFPSPGRSSNHNNLPRMKILIYCV